MLLFLGLEIFVVLVLNHLMVVETTIWVLQSKSYFQKLILEKVTKVRGMDIAITTNAQNDDDAKKLLAMFNFPFKG